MSASQENGRYGIHERGSAPSTSVAGALAQIAAAPISWGICDVEGWGHQLPSERVLAEMAACGVAATEAGPDGFLPTDERAARELVSAHGLSVVGGYVGLVLHRGIPAWRAELAAALTRLGLLGAEWVVVAALAAPATYDGRPELTAEQWRQLTRALDAATELAGEHGLSLAVHPHLATVVESPDDVRRVLDGSQASLCLDTGHYAVAGGQPALLIREAGKRIGYVHLKDIRASLAEAVRAQRIGFLEGVGKGLFCPLGLGDIELGGTLRELTDRGYRGWLVLEQDVMLASTPPPSLGPAEDARHSVRYIQTVLGG